MMNTATPAVAGASTTPSGIPLSRGVEYRCGDCGAKNLIKGGDPVRCRQCGFRILYKTRTKRCECFTNEEGFMFYVFEKNYILQ
jgi:DNA-directed RNA polymerase I, II, and III subunit RPABC4